MSRNQKVRGKAYIEPPKESKERLQPDPPGARVCQRLLCTEEAAHIKGRCHPWVCSPPQSPKTSVRVRPGFKRPQMQPSSAASMLHYANLWCLRSVNIMLPFSPNRPFADTVDQSPWSASYVSFSQTKSCLADHQNPNETSNKQQAQTMGTPTTLLGNNKMLRNSLIFFHYFNCKIYCVNDFQ